MYIVNNLTSNIVNISDLRVQIGPRQILDLEKVTDRMSIDRSVDLRKALDRKILRLVKHTLIKTNTEVKHKEVVEKIVERPASIDEEKLANLIRQVIKETKTEEKPQPQSDNNEANLKEFLKTIRQDIQNQFNKTGSKEKNIDVEIDPAKLAELQQKSVEKVAESIEISDKKKSKAVKITNKNSVTDLANEL